MKKFRYYNHGCLIGSNYPDDWNVRTEDQYIHTTKKTGVFIKYKRYALPVPTPDADVVCFNIKTWGRAGWNS